MKGQYLTFDAIVAGLIFIILVVTIFSFLNFYVFSDEFDDQRLDSTLTYVSLLLLSPGGSYSITPTNSRFVDVNLLNTAGDNIKSTIPYELMIRMKCGGFEKTYESKKSGVKWVSHTTRYAIPMIRGKVDTQNICKIDIFLGR